LLNDELTNCLIFTVAIYHLLHNFHCVHDVSSNVTWGRRDRMVVGFTTTYTFSVYHH